MMKLSFLCKFSILTMVIIINYIVLSIQYQLIVKLNTPFAPFIKFLNFSLMNFNYILNFKKSNIFGVFKKIILGPYGSM